jgi:hypothetical protein
VQIGLCLIYSKMSQTNDKSVTKELTEFQRYEISRNWIESKEHPTTLGVPSLTEFCMNESKRIMREEDPFWYMDPSYDTKIRSWFTKIQYQCCQQEPVVRPGYYPVKLDGKLALFPKAVVLTPPDSQYLGALEEVRWDDGLVMEDGVYTMEILPSKGKFTPIRVLKMEGGWVFTTVFVIWAELPQRLVGATLLRTHDSYFQFQKEKEKCLLINYQARRCFQDIIFSFKVVEDDPSFCADFCQYPLFSLSRKHLKEQLVPAMPEQLAMAYTQQVKGTVVTAVVLVDNMDVTKVQLLFSGALLDSIEDTEKGTMQQNLSLLGERKRVQTLHQEESVSSFFSCFAISDLIWYSKYIPYRFLLQCQRLNLILHSGHDISFKENPLFSLLLQYLHWRISVLAIRQDKTMRRHLLKSEPPEQLLVDSEGSRLARWKQFEVLQQDHVLDDLVLRTQQQWEHAFQELSTVNGVKGWREQWHFAFSGSDSHSVHNSLCRCRIFMATPTIMVESPSSSQTVSFLFFLDYLRKHNPYPPYPLLDNETLYGAFQRVVRGNAGLKNTPVRTLTRGKKLASNFIVSLGRFHSTRQECAHIQQCQCIFVLSGLHTFSSVRLRGTSGMSLMSQMLDVAHRLNDLLLIFNLVRPVQNITPEYASTQIPIVQSRKSQKKIGKKSTVTLTDTDVYVQQPLLCYKCKGPISWENLYPKFEIDGSYHSWCGDC